MLLPDVNILVHAYRTAAPQHEAFRQWLEDLVSADEAFGISDLVLSGFLRVVTNPRAFTTVASSEEALAFASALRAQPNCVVVKPGARHWQIFVDLCRKSNARANLVPDAYHAALAIESGSEWVTTDRDFARFPGLRWRTPF